MRFVSSNMNLIPLPMRSTFMWRMSSPSTLRTHAGSARSWGKGGLSLLESPKRSPHFSFLPTAKAPTCVDLTCRLPHPLPASPPDADTARETRASQDQDTLRREVRGERVLLVLVLTALVHLYTRTGDSLTYWLKRQPSPEG